MGGFCLSRAPSVQHLALLEDQILHAGLGAGRDAFLAVALDLVEAARERAVHDVAAHARRSRNLEDGGIGHHFGDRRAAGAVALRRVAALVEEALGEAADDGGVLVVEGDGKAGLADRREELVELAHVVAGEAHRVILVGRDLEGADPGVRELRDALGARTLLRRAVEGDVDDGDPLQGLDLGLKQVDRVDRQRVVEGHVDDGGDPAGGCRDRCIGEPRDPLAAPGMDLAVDDAGEDQVACGIDGPPPPPVRRPCRARRSRRPGPRGSPRQARGRGARGRRARRGRTSVFSPSAPARRSSRRRPRCRCGARW